MRRQLPTVVWLTPILPFINDTKENIEGILNYCVEAGVKGIICFNMGLTLRDGDREYFYQALDKSFPGMKKKYIIKKARKLLVEQINSHQTIVRNDMNNIETMSNMKGLSEVIPKYQCHQLFQPPYRIW